MAKKKSTSAKLTPEEELHAAGYPVETAHGVDADHADETAEDYADRIRGNPSAAIAEQQAEILAEQAEVTETQENADGQ